MSGSRRIVQFGAGNIGRSFLGQIFARNGWEVVFVDVDAELIRLLNERGSYDLLLKHPEGTEERLIVEGVRAVDAADQDALAAILSETRYVASSVGASTLPAIMPPLAAECRRRLRREPERPPFDLILAENIHNGAARVREMLGKLLPPEFPEEGYPGLIECSVGKMVPLIPEALRRREPTTVLAEPYNTLIVDRPAWKNPIPAMTELAPVENITAYVDRKLFIHNLGHAATAYLGYLEDPRRMYLWELLESEELRDRVRAVMRRSAEALTAEYPTSFRMHDLEEHIDDLLHRFRNRSLGDTVHRVGRDLPRKLSPDERLVGALRLVDRRGLDTAPLIEVYRAALAFRALDENGNLYPADEAFHKTLEKRGVEQVVSEISGIMPGSPLYHSLTVAGDDGVDS